MDRETQITFGKVIGYVILDTNFSTISEELYDQMEIVAIKKCNIDLLIYDTSTKHGLGKFNNIMVELHMIFMPVDFIIMNMGRGQCEF
jgi:hypothetical protein